MKIEISDFHDIDTKEEMREAFSHMDDLALLMWAARTVVDDGDMFLNMGGEGQQTRMPEPPYRVLSTPIPVPIEIDGRPLKHGIIIDANDEMWISEIFAVRNRRAAPMPEVPLRSKFVSLAGAETFYLDNWRVRSALAMMREFATRID